MATAHQMRAKGWEVMCAGAVVITAADFSAPGCLKQVQLYFLDEKRAVMDIVSKEDLLENWPEDGVYVLNPSGDEKNAILPVGTFYDEETDIEYVRVPENDVPQDELLPELPTVQFMDAVEQICSMKDK